MRKLFFAPAIGVLLCLGACATTPVAVGPEPTSGPAATVNVPSQLAGLATFTDADLKAGIAALEATNGGQPPTAVPLVDDYQCLAWMDTQLPTWIAAANGVVPTQKPAGPISAFIAVKIAAVNGTNAVNTITTTLGNDFAHNCGAAFAQDANFITQALANVGINVVVPATSGGLGGLLSGLPQL